MTRKHAITVEIEMTSGASEASLKSNIDEFINEIKYNTEMMKYHSWYNKINTSYDEQESVDISVTITDK